MERTALHWRRRLERNGFVGHKNDGNPDIQPRRNIINPEGSRIIKVQSPRINQEQTYEVNVTVIEENLLGQSAD